MCEDPAPAVSMQRLWLAKCCGVLLGEDSGEAKASYMCCSEKLPVEHARWQGPGKGSTCIWQAESCLAHPPVDTELVARFVGLSAFLEAAGCRVSSGGKPSSMTRATRTEFQKKFEISIYPKSLPYTLCAVHPFTLQVRDHCPAYGDAVPRAGRSAGVLLRDP